MCRDNVRMLPVLFLSIALADSAWCIDIFRTQSQVSKGPATPLIHDDGLCPAGPLFYPLALLDAIERSVCQSTKTHSAWAMVKAAAAGVGQTEGAYLPTVEGTAQYSAAHVDNQVKNQPNLQSSYSQPVNTEALSLGWLLYDFGGRTAAVRSSKQMLIAAQANQNLMLQTVFANTAKDYYTTQAGSAAVKAAVRIEGDAQQTLDAATARYKIGVAPITDELAASTASAQAVFQRAKAEGSYRLAVGALAIDMSVSPEEPLQLPDLDQSVLPDISFVHGVHDLIVDAIQSHPSVVVARAQWKASLEQIRTARAEGLPKLSVAGSLGRADQPLSASLGQPEYPAVTRQSEIGLSMTFPLFEGFQVEYRVRQAEAQAESEAQALRDAEQQVAGGVWSGFQMLQTATENLHNTELVLKSAQDSFTAGERRYRSGVGNIVDLLTAQTALATAEQQQIQAQLDWRTARIALALNLGQLGLWAVQ